jgi:hypothetical protein
MFFLLLAQKKEPKKKAALPKAYAWRRISELSLQFGSNNFYLKYTSETKSSLGSLIHHCALPAHLSLNLKEPLISAAKAL